MYNNGFQSSLYGYNATQPYLPSYQSQPATSNVGWVYVNGWDGAKSQIVQPGQTSWMMDNSDSIIYVKAVDSMGTATLKGFKLTEINAQPTPAQSIEYVTKSDLDGVLKRLSTIEEEIGGITK